MQSIAKINESELHQTVLDEIDGLLLGLQLDETEERVSKIITQVREIVDPFRKGLEENILELQKNVCWDAFVIAFYGETNAGKSTIIETLRIALGEKTKMEQRRAFRAKQEQLGLTDTALAEMHQAIEAGKRKVDALCMQRDERHAQYDVQRQVNEQEVTRLRALVAEKKKNTSFWRKLFLWVRKFPEQTALAESERQHTMLEMQHAAEQQQLAVQLEQAQQEYGALEAKQTEVLGKLHELEPLADGAIIGTGVSDYTRKTHEYTFEVNGQVFKLLDVPGIEGQESQVTDSILGAVKGAHAVFYVTNKPAAPQTGDQHGEGTLEKIRRHLGDQTEVWSIYNKRNTNPQHMLGKELLSQDERNSLAVLDATMREHLGENHYQKHIALSVQPAFLALADYLAPQANMVRAREKFLAESGAATWIEKSGFGEFVGWLKHNMISNCNARIRKANVNKITHVIQTAVKTLTQFQQETVSRQEQEIREEWTAADRQLQETDNGLGASLTVITDDAIKTFESNVRNTMYGRIDDGLDNNAVESAMKDVIQIAQKSLQTELKENMKKQSQRFQKNIMDVLKGFTRRVNEFQEALHAAANVEFSGAFNLNMEFASGVNQAALWSTLAGGVTIGVANFWNPVGWVVLSISAVTLLFGLWKAFRGFISDKYKKAQQRKSVDDNLQKIIEKMQETMTEKCIETGAIAKNKISELAVEVKKSVEQIAGINSALIRINANLTNLSKQLSH